MWAKMNDIEKIFFSLKNSPQDEERNQQTKEKKKKSDEALERREKHNKIKDKIK